MKRLETLRRPMPMVFSCTRCHRSWAPCYRPTIIFV